MFDLEKKRQIPGGHMAAVLAFVVAVGGPLAVFLNLESPRQVDVTGARAAGTEFAQSIDTSRLPAPVPEIDEDAEYDGVIITINKRVADLFGTLLINEILGDDVEVVDTIEEQAFYLVQDAAEDRSLEEFLKELHSRDIVLYAEPNYIAEPTYRSNDPELDNQWNYDQKASTRSNRDPLNNDMDVVEGWDVERADARVTIVAVIDSGVDYTHPDLKDNMWRQPISGCRSASGGWLRDGCPLHGWDFAQNDNDPQEISGRKGYGHGTGVAGVIASVTDNGIGNAGFSRYNNVKIMALRTEFQNFQIIKAINFARYNGAHVINASFGSNNTSSVYSGAIRAYSGIFVASAGNDDQNNDDDNPAMPASLNFDNIISVAGSTESGDLHYNSNYGEETVDVAAPWGVTSAGVDNTWRYFNGTSSSAPHVAAVAAMVKGHRPSLSTSQVRDIIFQSVKKRDDMDGDIATGGIVSLANALRITQGSEKLPDKKEEPPKDTCVDEGNGDNWGVDFVTFKGCWIGGQIDRTLCLDDGDGDRDGVNPGTGKRCVLGGGEPVPAPNPQPTPSPDPTPIPSPQPKPNPTPTPTPDPPVSAPFGYYTETNHPLCPPARKDGTSKPGAWDNSSNYANFAGPHYGCRQQKSGAIPVPRPDPTPAPSPQPKPDPTPQLTPTPEPPVIAPFGLYPGTDHPQCPPVRKDGTSKSGAWDNSVNFKNFGGPHYGCRQQRGSSTPTPVLTPSPDPTPIPSPQPKPNPTPTPTPDPPVSAPFGYYTETNHPLCPPARKDGTSKPGAWDNSSNYANFAGPHYGCRQQAGSGASTSNQIPILEPSSGAPFGYYGDTTTALCPSVPSRWGNVLAVGEWSNLGEWCADGSAAANCETYTRASCRR